MRRLPLLLLLLCLCFGLPMPLETAVSAPPAGEPLRITSLRRLEQPLAALLSDKSLHRVTVSVAVVDTASGETIFTRNATQRVLIASNVKLFTTATALETLGRDYEFITRLYACGERVAPERGKPPSILDGDLVVVASGDPNISGRFEESRTAIFDRWAAAVRAAGIETVKGNLVIDDTVFDRQFVPDSWPRNQLHKWYAAQTGGFSLNDNCIDITVSSGQKAGAPALVRFEPETDYVTIVNRIKTIGPKKGRHLIRFDRRNGTNTVVVGGTFKLKAASYSGHATIHNPSAFAGSVLHAALLRAGVHVVGPVVLADRPWRVGKSSHCNRIAEHRSTLARTLGVANKRSQNFYAEQLLKTVGFAVYEKGTFANGSKAVSELMLKKVGLPAGFTVVDGSGMSRKNRFSADDIARLLLYMHRSKNADAYYNSLAAPGVDYSLRKRLRASDIAPYVRAKTGTLNGVSALSGYADTADGSRLIFAIVMNGYKGGAWAMRQLQDKIVTRLVQHGKQ